MTSEQGKKGFAIATLISIVLGVIWAVLLYGPTLDIRSFNVIGLVFIVVLGLYTAFIALRARGQRDSS